MNKRKLIIIISIIILVIITLITVTIVNIIFKPKDKKDIDLAIQNNSTTDLEANKEDSEIKLILDNEAENLDEVKILIQVPEDMNQNYKIILPDETTTEEHITEYLVNKNGEYKFVFVFDDNNEIEKSIEVTNLKEDEKKNEPSFIPENFSYKSGTIDTGYTIEDQYGNEFVWVPVEDGIMIRKNSKKSNYIDDENNVKAFINSVLNYQGFYIAKYEASKANFNGEIVATSFYNVEPWYNISYKEATEASTNFCNKFGYDDISSMLVSSYAWDTTLNWLNHTQKSYSTSLDYGNYTDKINKTGTTEKDIINNICDMSGNLKEWTTEVYIQSEENNENTENQTGENSGNVAQETNNNQMNVTNTVTSTDSNEKLRVLKGGSINLSKPATSQISFSESVSNDSWGFRFVLYK